MLFGRHVQKNHKIKQIIYDIINFYFKRLKNFPFVKNDCLQHCVKIFIKKYVFDNYKSSKV